MPLRLRVIPASSRKRKSTGSRATPSDDAERSIDFDDGVGQIRIGRRADLELSLPFSPLSGVHARLVRTTDEKSGAWLLEDLGSTNGTFVGGERLKPGIKRALTAGTQIKLAEIKLIFDGEVPGNEATQTYVRRQISDVFSPGPATAQVPFLTAVSGIDSGDTTFRLEERDHVYMFGRTRRCEFRVNITEVSREHASFTRRADGIYVNDLGSVNGVLVNNTRVQEYRLFEGDLIQIGHVKLRLFDPTESAGRATESAPSPRSRLATPSHDKPGQEPPAAAERSATFRSEFHPAIAGALAHEGGGGGAGSSGGGGGTDTYRQRRPSVRMMLTDSWQSSSRFRYAIVIVAASLLAACAVLVGFRLAG